MSFNRWMDKQVVGQLYDGILLSNQKEPTRDSDNNVDEPQRHCAKGKKPDTKAYILYDSISMRF